MKKLLLVLTVIFTVQYSYAQESDSIPADSNMSLWKTSGNMGLMLNQVGLYRWQGGGRTQFFGYRFIQGQLPIYK